MLNQSNGNDLESHDDEEDCQGVLQAEARVPVVGRWRWLRGKLVSRSVILLPLDLLGHVEQLDLVDGQRVVLGPHGEQVLLCQPVVEGVEEAQAWCEESDYRQQPPQCCQQSPNYDEE